MFWLISDDSHFIIIHFFSLASLCSFIRMQVPLDKGLQQCCTGKIESEWISSLQQQQPCKMRKTTIFHASRQFQICQIPQHFVCFWLNMKIEFQSVTWAMSRADDVRVVAHNWLSHLVWLFPAADGHMVMRRWKRWRSTVMERKRKLSDEMTVCRSTKLALFVHPSSYL